MNKKTIGYIFLVLSVIFLLMKLSAQKVNEKIENEKAERYERNVLKEIIDSTFNEHPVFNENLKGKTIVVNVWATWCGPCKKEIPELNKLVNNYSSDDIVFIALNKEDSTEELQAMQKWDFQFEYQLYFNQEKLINIISDFKLGNESSGIPINMVIDQEGKIKHYYMGNRPEKLAEIKAYLEAISKKKGS